MTLCKHRYAKYDDQAVVKRMYDKEKKKCITIADKAFLLSQHDLLFPNATTLCDDEYLNVIIGKMRERGVTASDKFLKSWIAVAFKVMNHYH